MSKVRFARLLASPDEWNRQRLQVLLVAIALVIVLVISGVAWSVWSMLGRGESADPHASVSPRADSARDRIADAPLPAANLQQAQPGRLSTRAAGTIVIPPPTALGAVQVPTGYPHTTQGALAQLVALDQRAVQSASVVTAQDVIASWALPGGPTRRSWSGVKAVTELLSSAGLPANGGTDLLIVLRPAMGFIKGTVGGDYVVPCVDFVASITAGTAPTTRVAAADCQRMVWRASRWLIGSGPEPAPATSVWPGTQASYDDGYQWLEVGP